MAFDALFRSQPADAEEDHEHDEQDQQLRDRELTRRRVQRIHRRVLSVRPIPPVLPVLPSYSPRARAAAPNAVAASCRNFSCIDPAGYFLFIDTAGHAPVCGS